MPEYITTTESKEQLELVQQAWEVLTDLVEDLQTQLEGMKLKAQAQSRELQQHLERVVLEGNDARDLLHKKTVECTTIFKEVRYWMGVITCHNQGLEELWTRIQTLNKEATKTHNPLEQQAKFD
jgi:hypothetical protein